MKNKIQRMVTLGGIAILLLAIIGGCDRPPQQQTLTIGKIRTMGGQASFKPYADNPVITMGAAGEWDAGALGSMTVLKVGDVFHLYYEAWGVRSDDEWSADEYTSLQIGHATSVDGINWTKDPANPVVPKGNNGSWDADGTWDPFVLYEDSVFKMWYGGGQEICDWGYAVSNDGSRFEKKDRLSNLGGVEDNHVVHDQNAGLYYMYYWDRDYEPLALFKVASTTEDGFDYSKAELVQIDGEDYPMRYKFSHVIKEDGLWHMFYADFVRPHCADATTRYATSVDGQQWVSRNKNVLQGHDGDVLKIADNLYLMYYGRQGYFDRKDCDIRVAVYNGSLSGLADHAD